MTYRPHEHFSPCGASSPLRARSARVGAAVAAFAIAMLPVRLVAQERVDTAAVAAIIAEAEQRSEAADIFYELTDRLGPRLSRQSAVVPAVVAWHAAMRDDAIPRLPAPQSP